MFGHRYVLLKLSIYNEMWSHFWRDVSIISKCNSIMKNRWNYSKLWKSLVWSCIVYISISCKEYKRLSWSYLFQFHLLYIVHIIINCLMLGFSWKNCVIFASGKGHLFCAYSYWYHSSIYMWSSMNSILFYLFFSIYDKCDSHAHFVLNRCIFKPSAKLY